MQLWLDHIFRNTEAAKDFFQYVEKIEKNCFAKMQKALIDGDAHKATGLAYEVRAYQSLKNAYKAQTANNRNILKQLEE